MGWDGTGMSLDIAFKKIDDFIRQNNLNLPPRMSGVEVQRALLAIIDEEQSLEEMMWPAIMDPQTKPFLQEVSMALGEMTYDDEKLVYLKEQIPRLKQFIESHWKYIRKSYPQSPDSPKLT
ncbi:MAG TPA: hypothetical protein VGZ00_10035 [Candidatus Baltobacteraceae bacterium]|jgi:hypothetical protein|nr:hypothetical protein [Candidatus Baltobacteraceae bacterium]